MQTTFKRFVLTALTASLMACSAQQQSTGQAAVDNLPTQSQEAPTYQTIQTPATTGQELSLTMEQIMADPDWLGRQPQSPHWSEDGKSVFYLQKREGQVIRDLWQQPIEGGPAQQVALDALHKHAYRQKVLNKDKSMSAWVFQNNLFVSSANNDIKQLTRTDERIFNLKFLVNGSLSYQVGNAIYAVDVNSGFTEQLVSWKFAKAPEAIEPAEDYIAEQQLSLISVLAKRRQDKVDRFNYQQDISTQNPSSTAKAFYLPAKHKTVEASLSPNGKYLVLAVEKDSPSRADTDIMPNYVIDSGRIQAESVRRRVADAEPESHYLWFIDLNTKEQKKISYSNLPGYNDDVLEDVKRENAQAKGESYTANRLPRDIGLLVDWGWSQSAIAWHNSGEHVAVMLEAWDNKDRWLATVDVNSKKLVNQHRLQDKAWINYNFNSFGWLNNSAELYFLSEQTGYSHIYVKGLESKARQLTTGNYEVDELTLSHNDEYIYYQANQKHPGIYEIYRVNLKSGEIEALTDLNGMTDYVLSDAEDKLLLTHSKLTSPPELFVKNLDSNEPATQITDTTSDAFKQISWVAPEIVPIKSSHVNQPIYSRLYLPKNHDFGEKRRAVVFNHGAGYLQNSHLGWSGYFREFMFHNLLVQEGYVVLDMDYRASAGYGRDWRTAIYRHMGKPETEDLVDGVNWMVQNVNVDRDRVGTYGGSYGGFMTFMALFTEPDLFQAGAALRPVSDWAHYNHPYTSNILNTPDVDPIAYERSSPIYFAEGLTKPLLINAPMVDNNVFFVDVVRLVQRLIELEKENFETAIYPVEAHGFVEPSSWLDEYRRIFKLFEQNL